MSQPIGRKVMHLTAATIVLSGLTWFANQVLGITPTYGPPHWWNINNAPFLGTFTFNLAMTVIWSLVFAELVEPTFTTYQRLHEQSMHIIMAGVVAHLLWVIEFNRAPWWVFGLGIVVGGICFGVLHYYRMTGTMANAFMALVVGYAFGPIAFPIAFGVGYVITVFVASTLDSWHSNNVPFET